EAALETDVVVPAATNQQATACQRPTLDDDAIKHHDQATGADGLRRQRRGHGRGRIADDTESGIGNPHDGNIEIETLTRKLPEPRHARGIEDAAEDLGARQNEGGGRYGGHPYPRQHLKELEHTRAASVGVLDQENCPTPARPLMAQKDDEQIMEVIDFCRLDLETQLHQRPRKELTDAVARGINPHQVQIFPLVTFLSKTVEEGSEWALHAADKHGVRTMPTQATVQIGGGRSKRREAQRCFLSDRLEFTRFDQCRQWLWSLFIVWDQSSQGAPLCKA
ncbi:MAG: hypothetical protein QG595_1508, partial [Pseudomonadota bacterium]|nr:hypothetical protein [Pseudomonadota bacterium]